MKKYLALAVSFGLPGLLLAQGTGTTGTGGTLTSATSGLAGIVQNLTRAANALIPFFLAIAVVVFIYGVIKYILATGADDKALARNYIIYGIIGIAVIVSLFGLINLLQNTFGVSNSGTVNVPQF